jgi:ABC-2 type transport system permease protein
MFEINFFRQLKGFFLAFLKMQLRAGPTMFLGFIFPIILIVTFGYYSINENQNLSFGLVTDSSFDNVEIFQRELKNSGISLKLDSKKELENQLQTGKIDAILELTQKNQVRLSIGNDNNTKNTTIQRLIQGIIHKLTVEANDLFIPYELSTQTIPVNLRQRYIDFSVPGLIGFSLLSSAITSTAFSFLALRNSNILKQIFAAPTSSVAFILGQALAKAVFIFSQSLGLLALAFAFFKYIPKNGLESLWQILILMILGLIVFLGLGYMLAGLFKNQEALSPIANIVVFSQLLLAGTLFPTTNLPYWLQRVAQALPLYNFNSAFRYLSLEGLNLWSQAVLVQLSILIGWGLLFYLVAVQVFRIRKIFLNN